MLGFRSGGQYFSLKCDKLIVLVCYPLFLKYPGYKGKSYDEIFFMKAW